MIEIEKKYRLTAEERELLLKKLRAAGALREKLEFEENTIYTGGQLDPEVSVLRLRRVGETALLTYKERYPSSSPIKHQREEETRVEDAAALALILDALGFVPALVYEKRRETWKMASVELVIDELPFGLFAEIEGEESAILEAEKALGLATAKAELATYPQLTAKYGVQTKKGIEARFKRED